jgi:NitT/TauT family transport system substrate-binding protein
LLILQPAAPREASGRIRRARPASRAGERETSHQVTMSIRNLCRTAAGLLVAMSLAGAAGAAETGVRFSLDSRFEGPAAPFLLALDKGYFKAQGLNVSVDPAEGPLEPFTRVASGTYDIGFGDINALIKFRDANPRTPLTAVFVVYNRPPFAILGRKSRGIATPKDLEGKKLGAPAADSAYAQWPIFVEANNIDAAKVTVEPIGVPVREPMLAAGQVDAITGLSFSSFVNLKSRGVPVNDIAVLLMADYGVELYGNAIFVSPKFAADHPDAVKGFLSAFTRALRETVKSPAAAIDLVLKRNDLARKDIELERLTMAIRDNILTPEVKANGYGGIDEARFARAIDQIAIAYRFKTAKPKPGEIFDASFLPPAAERKAN